MSIYMHKLRRSFLALIGIVSLTITGLTSPAQGEDLGGALESVNWKDIIGTWVDSESKGERVTLSYSWKFENKVIEVNSKMGELKSVSLMVFNPESEEVFMAGGNNKGGGSMGKWSIDNGDAVLDLSYIRSDGEKGKMKIRHHRVDKDTIKVTGSSGDDSGEGFTITLVRKK